jgi:hypothetical protein
MSTTGNTGIAGDTGREAAITLFGADRATAFAAIHAGTLRWVLFRQLRLL